MRSAVAQWGHSLAVRLPKKFAESAGLGLGTEVELSAERGQIVLTRARPRYRLADLLEGHTPDKNCGETDWGAPRGKEAW